MNKTKRVVFTSVAVTVATVGVLNIADSIYAGVAANAATSGLTMSATIEPSSTVTIGANAVNLDIVPSTSGTFKSNYVAVSAYTNTTNTCNVTMTTSSSDLTSGANKIPSLTSAVSESEFSVNSWGYRAGSSGDYNPVATGEPANPVATLTSMTGSNAVTTNVYFAAKLNQAIKPGTYSNTVTFASTCPPPPVSDISELTYMQDFADLTSSEKSDVLGSMTAGTQYQLKDSRDQKEYYISKLADGNVWMTQNLNLAGGTKLDSDGSNVPAGYTQSSPYYTLPASTAISSGTSVPSDQFSDNATAYVFNTGNNTTTCNSSTPCNSYYSWLAATAGGKDSSGNDVTGDGYNTAYSICPKGWRLPTATTEGVSRSNGGYTGGDFYQMILAVTGQSSLASGYYESAATFYNNAGPGTTPNFLLAGRYGSGSFYGGGSGGFYWSATSLSSTGAYILGFDSSRVYSADYYGRRYGFSVRCVFGG